MQSLFITLALLHLFIDCDVIFCGVNSETLSTFHHLVTQFYFLLVRWLTSLMAAHSHEKNFLINPSGVSTHPSTLWTVADDTLLNRQPPEVCEIFLDPSTFDEGFYNSSGTALGSDVQRAIIKPRGMWWDSQQISANVSGRGSARKAESSVKPPSVLYSLCNAHTWRQRKLWGDAAWMRHEGCQHQQE